TDIPTKWLSKYDKIFSISNAVRQDTLKRGGPDSMVIYNGIYFLDVDKKISYQKNTNYGIVQVGSLRHLVKGQDILVKALHHLVQKNHNNIQLDIIGEGASMGYLENLVRELRVEKQVNFL